MNRKRNLIYVVIIVAGFVSVIVKQLMINQERRQVIVSSVSEWREKGRPVAAAEVKRSDVVLHTKVTAWQVGDRLFEGYVSKEIRNQIKVGQEMLFRVDGTEFKGTISMIADEISLETGMYQVQVSFAEPMELKGWVVAYAYIDTLQNVICVSNEIIDSDNGVSFVWKVVDGKAVRQPITIGQRDGYGAVVTQGLSEGDLVVTKGFSMLSEGDKVNIMKEFREEESSHD